MKTIKILFIFTFITSFLHTNAQEKKIKFSKGTLKICSSKNFKIEGYDGNEVIVKSLHEKRNSNLAYVVSGYSTSNRSENKKLTTVTNTRTTTISPKDSSKINNSVYFFKNDRNRKKGLKKLGKNNENIDLGIYFIIEQNGDELIFKDNNKGRLIMTSNERYEIKIPNSIKLDWQTNSCIEQEVKSNQYRFFNSKASSLSNFDGEVEISSTLNNTKLVDVTGPVSINTIGGNVTIEFDKKMPQKLYSIYSNNGFIDITLPEKSDIKLDATGRDVFSDINFEVEEEKKERDLQNYAFKVE